MSFIPVNLSLAFTAGMVAAFNPCGVVLLPTYIAYLITQQKGNSNSIYSTFKLGIKVGGLMTLGFISVFLIAGITVSALGTLVFKLAPWLAVVVGIVFTTTGIILLIKPEKFQLISQFTSRAGANIKEKNSFNFYLYGIGYAVASLGCTLPVFMVAIFTSFTAGNFYQGIINFLLYGLGMGIVVTAITFFSLLAKKAVEKWLRKIVPYINTAAALFILLTGLYLIYYWTIGPGSL